MSTTLRFPSGLTVTQAKKDAKKLAKAESIKLHEAQDRTSRSNGLNMSWNKALAWLERQPKPLMSFRLSLNSERNEGTSHHLIDLYPEAPVVLIAGTTGSGKSVIALELAHQAITKSAIRTYYCTMQGLIFEAATGSQDINSKQIGYLQQNFPNHFHIHSFSRGVSPLESMDNEVTEGSLLIIDEVALFKLNQNSIIEWLAWARRKRCVLILIGQMIEDIAPSASKDQEEEFASYIGAVLLGRTQCVSEDTAELTRELLKFTQTLDYSSREYIEFVALATTPGWMGILRQTLPDWQEA